MAVEFGKLQFQSLKEMFLSEIERRILSDELKPGDRLPPERDLAARMGVSRTVVNAGILELASRGFLRVVPRKGTFVNDYRHEGTLAIFSTLLKHLGQEMDLKLFFDSNTARKILEVECARSAAANRSAEDLEVLRSLMETMETSGDTETVIAANVRFHHQIAIASGNMILCVLLNSFKDIMGKVLLHFYSIPSAVRHSLDSHRALLGAIEKGDGPAAAAGMERIFRESEALFRKHRKV